jgi:hypothetical protein
VVGVGHPESGVAATAIAVEANGTALLTSAVKRMMQTSTSVMTTGTVLKSAGASSVILFTRKLCPAVAVNILSMVEIPPDTLEPLAIRA